jgi:hypothetical protein
MTALLCPCNTIGNRVTSIDALNDWVCASGRLELFPLRAWCVKCNRCSRLVNFSRLHQLCDDCCAVWAGAAHVLNIQAWNIVTM